MTHELTFDSLLGKIKITAENNVITSCIFTDQESSAEQKGIVPSVLKEAEQQITQYFQGKRKAFHLPLNPKGTDFQKLVWQKLQEIPYGQYNTYGKLAAQLGDVKKVRAVAGAIAKNPIAILIPCHRVVGARGELTGFAWGIARKKALLKMEGAAVVKLELF